MLLPVEIVLVVGVGHALAAVVAVVVLLVWAVVWLSSLSLS